MPTIIEDADLRVNTPSEKHQQTPLDLSGMELAHIEATREKARARWRAANPNPTPRDIARMEALLSDMSSDAKLFAVAIIELGGLESGPVSMPRREAQILLSKSKDGFASAAEKFGEWAHAKVDKGEAGKKHRYSILQNVLDFSEKNRPAPQASSKKPACSSGRFLEDEPACPTGQSPQKRPAGRATSPIGRGDNPDKSQKGGVVFTETATPNEGNGSGRALTPTPTLPSPDPDIPNPDITARECIGAGASKRPGKYGPRDPFGLNPMTREAKTSVFWGDDGRLHVMNGFAAELSSILPEGEDLQISLDAIAQWVPIYEDGIGLMKAVRSQITKRAQDLKRLAAKAVDRSNGKGYTEPTKEENSDFWDRLSAKIKEKENAKSNGPLPEAPKAIF